MQKSADQTNSYEATLITDKASANTERNIINHQAVQKNKNAIRQDKQQHDRLTYIQPKQISQGLSSTLKEHQHDIEKKQKQKNQAKKVTKEIKSKAATTQSSKTRQPKARTLNAKDTPLDRLQVAIASASANRNYSDPGLTEEEVDFDFTRKNAFSEKQATSSTTPTTMLRNTNTSEFDQIFNNDTINSAEIIRECTSAYYDDEDSNFYQDYFAQSSAMHEEQCTKRELERQQIQQIDEEFGVSTSVIDYDKKDESNSSNICNCPCGTCLILSILAIIGAGVAIALGLVRDSENVTKTNDVLLEHGPYKSFIEGTIGQNQMDDANGAYYKALRWITYNDPMELVPDENGDMFIQRFIMVSIYYSTSMDYPWSSCNAPERVAGTTTTPLSCTLSQRKKSDSFSYQGFETSISVSWLTDVSECSWAGVTCNDLGHVTAIDIGNMRFSGEFPDGVQYLPSLHSLELSYGKLSGVLPDTVSSLENLVELNLQGNAFTGAVPQSWFERLTKLQHLDLSGNKLNGKIIEYIQHLQSLQVVSLSNNKFDGTMPSDIGDHMTQLRILAMDHNNVGGSISESFGRLDNLEYLSLQRNQLEGSIADFFWLMNNIEYIDLGQNQLDGTLSSSVGFATKLTTLLLHGNSMTGTLPEELSNLQQLVKLDLSVNGFSETVPESVCELPLLSVFATSCLDDVYCSCCTVCCNHSGSTCHPTTRI